ncbi:MAG: transglutaminase domain-containing protein, partial [Planctomycetota bacterium]
EVAELPAMQPPDQMLPIGFQRRFLLLPPSLAAVTGQPIGSRRLQVKPPPIGDLGNIRASIEELTTRMVGQNDCRWLEQIRILEHQTDGGILHSFDIESISGPVVTAWQGRFRNRSTLTFRWQTAGWKRSGGAMSWSDETSRGFFALEALGRQWADPESTENSRPTRRFRMLRYSPVAETAGKVPIERVDIRTSQVGESLVPDFDSNLIKRREMAVAREIDEVPREESVRWLDSQGDNVRQIRADGQVEVHLPDDSQSPAFLSPPGGAAVLIRGKAPPVSGTPLLALKIRFYPAPVQNEDDKPDASASEEDAVADTDAEVSPVDTLLSAPGQWVIKQGDTWRVLLLGDGVTAGELVRDFRGYRSEILERDTLPTELANFDDRALTDYKTLINFLLKSRSDAAEMEAAKNRDYASLLISNVMRLVEPADAPRMVGDAASIAKENFGDPVGRALLATAILRSRGIPTRLALGLRLDPNWQAARAPAWMHFDAWPIVWVDSQWVPMDLSDEALESRDLFNIHATRLTLGIPELRALDVQRSLQSCFETMQRLQIEVSGWRRQMD